VVELFLVAAEVRQTAERIDRRRTADEARTLGLGDL
jgi:hypothetical protein